MTLGLEIPMQSRASPSSGLNYRLLCSSRSKTTCPCSNTDHKNTILCEKEIKHVDIHINNLDGHLEHMHRKQICIFYTGTCMLKGTYQTQQTAPVREEAVEAQYENERKTCKKRKIFIQIKMIVRYELECVIQLTNK